MHSPFSPLSFKFLHPEVWRKFLIFFLLVGLFPFLTFGNSFYQFNSYTLPPTISPHTPQPLNELFRNPNRAEIAQSYAKLPLIFEANQGQVDESVKFFARGHGYGLFLTGAEAIFNLTKGKDETPSFFRMQLVGAQSNSEVYGLNQLSSKTNYFIGNKREKWKTNIAGYEKVRYNSIYPGIDLVYYGNDGQLEYDFVVRPGADPSSISLSFVGTDKVEISNEGTLLLYIDGEIIILQKPILYQSINGIRKQIAGNFSLSSDQSLKFDIGRYDPSYELIIDPVLIYSTYLGGSGSEGGARVTVDAQGNIYLLGETLSTDFPILNALQSSKSGVSDLFVTKLDSTGNTIIYSTYIGGSGAEGAGGIAVNANGEVYGYGTSTSSDFPLESAYQQSYAGNNDAVLFKLNAAGSAFLFSTYLGGSLEEGGYDMTLDGNGNAYLTGYTLSANFPINTSVQTTIGGNQDAFVTKMSSTGGLFYSTFLGGTSTDVGQGIAVDTAGNAYVTGSTGSSNFPLMNPLQSTKHRTDAFVSKINPAGSALVYSTFLGGGLDDDGRKITVDQFNNAYIIGFTESNDFPTVNPMQSNLNGPNDIHITKINDMGNSIVFSTYLGGSGADDGSDIAVDNSSNVYITGRSSDFPTFDAIQANHAGSQDAIVAKLDASGSGFIFSTYLGGSGFDQGVGIALGSSNAVYVIGTTDSGDFPTVNPYQSTNNGSNDAFLLKLGESNQPPTVDAGGPYDVSEGATVQVMATGNDPENHSLSYSWDLDNNGSFETPGQSVTFSATNLDGPNISTITVQVTDEGNLTAIDQATVNILNITPTVGSITTTLAPVQVNTSINASASFSDPGVFDTHTAVWDWGDGTTTGMVTESNGSGSVSDSHIYTAPGVYTIKLTVTDDDGGSGESIFQYVVVYDPSEGFVTGAGAITSPVGAYTPSPSLTGKAIFGFVSKYQNGANVPTGHTHFRFTTAQVTFQSTSYDWLVVGGPKAQYKGSGTINGSGNYGFILTSIDGQINGGGGTDKFRIKIYDKTTNEVIYDNQMGDSDTSNPTTVIDSGSIKIHK